jgi:hypothetical protein
MGHGALLVSIPKGGTHLVASALVRCGYLECGAGLVSGGDNRSEMIARLMATEPFVSLLRDHDGVDPDKLLFYVCLEAMARPQGRDAATGKFNPREDVPELAAALARLRHDHLFPPNVVFSMHVLPHDDRGGAFFDEWIESGRPRVIFNYRDPRDQLTSMVHFLRDSPVAGQLGEQYGPILRSLATWEEQLSYAIECPTFPFRHVYRMNAWMLKHPNVLKIRFEDIVGPNGGGSAASQRDAVRGLAGFLGFTIEADDVAAGLYGGTRTFRAGRQGGWEQEFSDCHRRAFARHFGDVLALYGYD